MTSSLIVDDVVLLLRDDRGRSRTGRVPPGMVVAGAALAALALDEVGRVAGPGEPGVRAGRLTRTGRAPVDTRLTPLLDRVDGRRPKDAVSRLSSRGIGSGPAERLEREVLEGLAARGAVRPVPSRWLGVWPRTDWVPVPGGERDAVTARVRAVLTGSGPGAVDARTAATVALLLAAEVLPKVVPEVDRRTLKARAREVAASQWAGEAVKKAVEEMFAAMLVTVAAAGAVAAS